MALAFSRATTRTTRTLSFERRRRVVRILPAAESAGKAMSSTSTKEEEETTYSQLKEKLAEIDCLSSLQGLAGWDELTMMPSGEHAALLRSKASAVLAGVIHQKSIDSELGKLIANSQPSRPKDIANVKRAKEEYERSAKIPSDMAKKAAELQSEGYLSQYTPLLVRPLLRTV